MLMNRINCNLSNKFDKTELEIYTLPPAFMRKLVKGK